MAVKKWAMVIMNAGYDPEKDMARLDLEQVETCLLYTSDAADEL